MDHAETDVPVNERQQWFLNRLEEGGSGRGADLAHRWNVTKERQRGISQI